MTNDQKQGEQISERFTFKIETTNDRDLLRASFYDGDHLDFIAEEQHWVGAEIWLSLDGYPNDSGPLRDIVLTREQAAQLAPLISRFAEYGTIAEPPLEVRIASALEGFGEKETKADTLIKAALLEEVESMGRDGEC